MNGVSFTRIKKSRRIMWSYWEGSGKQEYSGLAHGDKVINLFCNMLIQVVLNMLVYILGDTL